MKTALRMSFTSLVVATSAQATQQFSTQVTPDDGKPFLLRLDEISPRPQHTSHLDRYGKYVTGINRAVLAGIDKVQARAMDGGTYYVGEGESPLPFALSLWGQPLLAPPRSSSYCTGAAYGAFIEALNFVRPTPTPSVERMEAFRMQEPDGTRRNDYVKFWGKWNGDNYGAHYALHQYTGMGDLVSPASLRPGDFLNIVWKARGGHMVVFLGWFIKDGEPNVLYWSSQKATNGLGDASSPLSKIKWVTAARLHHLERMATFDISREVEMQSSGHVVDPSLFGLPPVNEGR